MTLCVAVSILVCDRLQRCHGEYAHTLLVYFVDQARILYGQEFLVYNVHSMIHISADAKEFGCVDNISAFPFENYLQHLKRLVRSGKKPLTQIIKRISELQHVECKEVKSDKELSTKRPNNSYIMNNLSCCEVVEITNEQDEQPNKMLLCRVYERTQALFAQPCESHLVGIYKVDTRGARMKMVSDICLDKKAIMIINEKEREAIFMALLHEGF